MVDWAYKIDPLRCISMHGITERYISGQKADAAGFVRILLDDLENRISGQFSRVSYYSTKINLFLNEGKKRIGFCFCANEWLLKWTVCWNLDRPSVANLSTSQRAGAGLS